MDIEKVSEQIQALDKPEKLRIVTLLSEEGRKSISAVARELDIHFSTTHKYLEQLEEAGLVRSKTVKEDRLKRYFYVKDFNIELSPSALTASPPSEKDEEDTFKVINNRGELIQFNRRKFMQPYMQKGLPTNILEPVVKSIERSAYDYITYCELDAMLKDKLREYAGKIKMSVNGDALENTYLARLRHKNKNLLQMHQSGDIFIRNLETPKLEKYVHDIRSILIHGTNGKAPEDLSEALDQILDGINIISKMDVSTHLLESFNYLIAPVIKNPQKLKSALCNFMKKLSERNERFIISLDVGTPRYAEIISPSYFYNRPKRTFGSNRSSYKDCIDLAEEISSTTLSQLQKNNYNNIEIMFKTWSGELPETELDEYYVANMTEKWQGMGASYIGSTRLDSSWRGWIRTVRTGELQKVAINLPRLAIDAKKDTDEFVNLLKTRLHNIVKGLKTMDELSRNLLLARYKMVLPSVQREKWTYLSIEHCLHRVTLANLPLAIKVLTGRELWEKSELAKKILETCNKIIKEYSVLPLRITLGEEVSSATKKRFEMLNTSFPELNKYDRARKLGKKNRKAMAALNQYLPGSHKTKISKDELNEFLGVKGGLLKIS